MQGLGKLMHHFRLISRMAQTTQTDLATAYDAGDLSQEDWAEMVQTCRSCDWAGDCPEWLDRQDTVENAPKTCLNHERFRSLKAARSPHKSEGA